MTNENFTNWVQLRMLIKALSNQSRELVSKAIGGLDTADELQTYYKIKADIEALEQLIGLTPETNALPFGLVLEKKVAIAAAETIVQTPPAPPQQALESTVVKYDPRLSIADIIKIWVIGAVEHHESKKAAAFSLGVTVKSLYNHLHKYDLFEKYKLHW